MNAAILMAKTASLYRCLAKSVERPGELLGKLNHEICETASRGMFVTMAAGVLDPETGCVSLANAGHEPPLWHAAGGHFGCVPADAPPLGIAPGIVPGDVFPESDLSLEGGSLYLFTDGLTEAETATGEQLGAEGVQELIARWGPKPLAERVDAIVAEASRLYLRDDLTLLALCDPAGARG
jgi:sigma-B regulation protein RsbU (phosphoserine phosphatase)